jgi:hypothetical protein
MTTDMVTVLHWCAWPTLWCYASILTTTALAAHNFCRAPRWWGRRESIPLLKTRKKQGRLSHRELKEWSECETHQLELSRRAEERRRQGSATLVVASEAESSGQPYASLFDWSVTDDVAPADAPTNAPTLGPTTAPAGTRADDALADTIPLDVVCRWPHPRADLLRALNPCTSPGGDEGDDGGDHTLPKPAEMIHQVLLKHASTIA